MLAYQYDAQGRFIGAVEDYGLLPNTATHDAPPDARPGFERFRHNGKWEYREDHRGETYWLPDDAWDAAGREMTDFGPLPEGALTSPPEKPEAVRLAEVQQAFTDAIQQRLDDFARTRGYDNIMSACSYFGSANPRFKQEADRAIALRDATWAAAYALLDDVLSGQRPMPTFDEVCAALPALTWEE